MVNLHSSESMIYNEPYEKLFLSLKGVFMSRKLLCFILTLLLSTQLIWASPLPELSCDGAVLMDAKTGTVLYSKNKDLAFYPASTTKIITSLAILQDMTLDTIVTKTQDAIDHVPSDNSQIGLNVGDTYTVYDGLHAVLMASDNFVCYDLAKFDAGSIENFAGEMNALATLAGGDNFHFVNPHGYHDANHYTSPFSLAKIAVSAFNNPTLEEIAGTLLFNFTVANTGRIIPLKHTVALLDSESPYYNPAVTAAKSGFHNEAKRTLVAKAVYGDMELIGVVMRTDAPHQFEDMNKLFAYGSTNFTPSNDLEGHYTLSNQSYSAWSAPYVTEALINGWITPSTTNYQAPISQRAFLNLLKAISPERLTDTVSAMISSDHDSIFIENNSITRASLAKIIADYMSHYQLILLPSNETATDISELPKDIKDAIEFCTTSKILSLKDGKFNPTALVSYEEALCIISKLNGIISRYESYHL